MICTFTFIIKCSSLWSDDQKNSNLCNQVNNNSRFVIIIKNTIKNMRIGFTYIYNKKLKMKQQWKLSKCKKCSEKFDQEYADFFFLDIVALNWRIIYIINQIIL